MRFEPLTPASISRNVRTVSSQPAAQLTVAFGAPNNTPGARIDEQRHCRSDIRHTRTANGWHFDLRWRAMGVCDER
jgi:hypothetical protein